MSTRFYIVTYLALFGVALIIAIAAWELVAPGRWFYCDDSIGFSFIPPFAHTDVTVYGHTEDRYLVAPSFVYSVWGLFVSAVLLLPAFGTFIISRLRNTPNKALQPTADRLEKLQK